MTHRLQIILIFIIVLYMASAKKNKMKDTKCHRETVRKYGIFPVFSIALLANIVAIYVWNGELGNPVLLLVLELFKCL